MALLLAAVKEASEEFDNPRKNTQQRLLHALTHRGQVAAAQAQLFKALQNQVWPGNKTPFY